MKRKCLVVVDMQNDFVTGSLGTKEGEAIVGNVVDKVNNFDGEVLFTKDTHPENYLDTQEGKNLPVVHCIKDTEGWELVPELAAIVAEKGYRVFEKPTFGSVELANYLKKKYDDGELESVELVGICTDICVISNALMIKAFMPELPMKVDSSCCAGVTVAKHEAALEAMRSCQLEVL